MGGLECPTVKHRSSWSDRLRLPPSSFHQLGRKRRHPARYADISRTADTTLSPRDEIRQSFRSMMSKCVLALVLHVLLDIFVPFLIKRANPIPFRGDEEEGFSLFLLLFFFFLSSTITPRRSEGKEALSPLPVSGAGELRAGAGEKRGKEKDASFATTAAKTMLAARDRWMEKKSNPAF